MDLHSESQRTQTEDDQRTPKAPPPLNELLGYVPSLGQHVGEVLVSLDKTLAMVSEDTWSPETQQAVRKEIGFELISGYVEGSNLLALSPAMLEEEAKTHLARFAIATSLLITEREKRARCVDPGARPMNDPCLA